MTALPTPAETREIERVPLVTVTVREPDPVLAAMHRQREPWTAEQYAFAEALGTAMEVQHV